MDCFNHKNIPAVGLCKSCMKGVCHDCHVEVDDGLACKGSCEDKVEVYNSMIAKSVEYTNAVPKLPKLPSTIWTDCFNIILGVIFVGYWYLKSSSDFLLYVGIALLTFGAFPIVKRIFTKLFNKT